MVLLSRCRSWDTTSTAPTELLQGHGQCQAHLQVQVVGRFVEQQQVGPLPGNQRQGQAGLFAAGEVQHRFVDARTAKIETAKEVAQGLLALGGGQALQVQQGAGLAVQRIELVLGKVAHHQVLAAHQASGQRLQLAGQVLDQGRFAGAVGAQQARCAHPG